MQNTSIAMFIVIIFNTLLTADRLTEFTQGTTVYAQLLHASFPSYHAANY